MPSFNAPAGSRITVRVRVDKIPFLAGFQTPPRNSQWENITDDPDGLGQSREFVMSSPAGTKVSFNVRYATQIGPDDPDPQATYTITFSTGDGDLVVVSNATGAVPREYTFTAT